MIKYFMNRALVFGMIVFLSISSVIAQNDTLKVFNFESCKVSFIEIGGFKNIVFENDTLHTVLLRETLEAGTNLNDLEDVKVGENCSVGLFVRQGPITTFTILILQNSKFEIANISRFEFDPKWHNFRVSMLTHNTIFKESLESSSKNEVKIYGEDGYVQIFKGEKPFMNQWILDQKKGNK